MAQYRCYFFGTNGQLVGAETIIQDNDDDARTAAMKLFAQRAYTAGFDLRCDHRSIAAQEVARDAAPPHSVAA
jgi:hypothetical protein